MNSSINALARALLCMCTLVLVLFSAGAQAQTNNAAFVTQSVTQNMVTGTAYDVSVTMTNTGTTTWTTANSYSLGSRNPENNLTWGGRVPLPNSVAPGGQVAFVFRVTAPSTPGSYNFQWSMLREGVEWFGPFTPNVVITVSAPAPQNGAQVVGLSVPSPMVQGQTYSVAVTMKNTGNTTWPAGTAYNLGSTNPYDTMLWGLKRISLKSAVAPGQQYPFSFTVTAPAAGSYTMGWGMVQEYVEWFGATSSSPVTVSAPAQTPTISVSRTPSPMTAGQPYTLNWSSTNATSISRICTASGTGYTVNDAPALNGPSAGTASAAWVGYPSACTWKATGAGGGTATFNETMTTNAAAPTDVVTYIHTDGLGSPVARTNTSGGLVSRTRYEPYGLTAAGTTLTIGFTGHVNDADTGLVYMQQRYYDPVAGRMLSIDPVTTDANKGSSFNRYVYAENSPYTHVDPDGRQAIVIIGRPRNDDPFYSPVQSSRGGDPIARKIVQIFNNVTTPSPSPIPPDDDKDKKDDKQKRPNDKLEKGDELDLARFDRRVKVEGETRFQDQKSGYQISPERSSSNPHGGSAWKLINRAGERVATLDKSGRVLGK